MRPRIYTLLGFVISAGLLGLGVWAFIQAVQDEPAVVGSIATAVGGVVVVLYQQRRAERERLREAHRERMAPIYEEFLTRLRDQVGEEEVGEEMMNFLAELKGKQLLLGASSEVIRAFNAWSAASAAEGDPLAALVAYDDVLRAIRADLGHDNSKLERGDLLRLFVSDIDQHIPASD